MTIGFAKVERGEQMSVLIKGIEIPRKCIRCPINVYGRCLVNDDKDVSKATADAVKDKNCPLIEIVHCKDCVYMERGVKDSNEVWCCWHDSRMMENDFCSRGKEKDVNTD